MGVKTRDELTAELDRLIAADRLEEASEVLDQIEPLSDAEWLAWVQSAEEVDEEIPAFIRERIEEFERFRDARGRRAG